METTEKERDGSHAVLGSFESVMTQFLQLRRCLNF